MNGQPKRFYEFGLFRIDTEERQLLRDGRAVSLTPKVFDLLLVLVENKGHTLGKDELMQRVWGDTFVEENNLSRNISMLRKVLGDESRDARYIKTVPKRGYRFKGDVREILENEETLIVERRTNFSLAFREEIQKDAFGDAETRGHRDARIFSLTNLFSRYRLDAALSILIISAAVLIWANRARNDNAHATVQAENQTIIKEKNNAEAFELYRRGRELWRNRSAAGLHEATLLLEQAVEKDPNFALAHAALADAYAFDVEKWKMTEAAANRAIELDPDLGKPYASIGFVKLFWEWKLGEAEHNFKKAIALSPDYATAHQWFAVSFLTIGQTNQALAELSRALELEPDSIAVNADMCQMLYYLERYGEAEAQCKKTLEMDANSFNAHSSLYLIYTAKGMYREAVEEFFKREQLTVNHSTLPPDLKELKTVFDRGGIRAFWQMRIKHLQRPTPDKGYMTAQYYAMLGDKNQALRHLRLAFDNRDFGFPFFLAEPLFRSCCLTDPRYSELGNLWTKGKI